MVVLRDGYVNVNAALKEVDGIHLRRGRPHLVVVTAKEQTTKSNIERIEDLTGKKIW